MLQKIRNLIRRNQSGVSENKIEKKDKISEIPSKRKLLGVKSSRSRKWYRVSFPLLQIGTFTFAGTWEILKNHWPFFSPSDPSELPHFFISYGFPHLVSLLFWFVPCFDLLHSAIDYFVLCSFSFQDDLVFPIPSKIGLVPTIDVSHSFNTTSPFCLMSVHFVSPLLNPLIIFFIHCSFTRSLWGHIFSLIDLSGVQFHRHLEDLTSTDLTEALGFLSACSHWARLEGKESPSFWEFYRRSFLDVGVLCIFCASWFKCDRTFSSYSFETFQCNFWSVLLAHGNDPGFFLSIKFAFRDQKKKRKKGPGSIACEMEIIIQRFFTPTLTAKKPEIRFLLWLLMGLNVTICKGYKKGITQYFQDLYSKNQQPGAWFTEWKGKSLTPETASRLETGKTLLTGCYQNSSSSIAPNKAPGPDGFTMAFFQHCWDTVKDDLLALLRDFHSNGKHFQSS